MTVYGKLILGVLFAENHQQQEILIELEKSLKKPIQHHSSVFPFVQTGYYEQEMGKTLKRCFVSIEGLEPLETIYQRKHQMALLEKQWVVGGKRQVNLDPGYLDFHKVVLLSHKSGPQKIYLKENIWADMVLIKKKGGYDSFRWTFPDLLTHQYDDFFLQARHVYKYELKQL